MLTKDAYAQSLTTLQSEVRIAFTMTGAGAADLTAGTDSAAQVTSAVYSATGLYAIVLAQSGKTLVSADIKVRGATAKQHVYHNWTAATRTLNLRVFTAPDTAAAIALNDILEVKLTFKDA